jgi:hypothetical protein
VTILDQTQMAAEQKKVRRHKIARRLYEELVGQNSNRVITLRDGAGEVVAHHDPRAEQDAHTSPPGDP